MSVKTVSTEKAPAAIGPYSQATAFNGMVFVSGQLGFDPSTGEFVGDDVVSQARQALENLQAIVEAAGSDLTKVLSVDVFLTDMKNFVPFNEVYGDFFSEHKPARAAIEVSALPRGGIVEIKCIAAL